MTDAEGVSRGSNPGVRAADVVLQRGAGGQWALTESSGAWIEADAAVFVEVGP